MDDKLADKMIDEAKKLKIRTGVIDGINYLSLVRTYKQLRSDIRTMAKYYQPNFLFVWMMDCRLDIRQLSQYQDITGHLDHNLASNYPLSTILFDYNRHLDSIIYLLKPISAK